MQRLFLYFAGIFSWTCAFALSPQLDLTLPSTTLEGYQHPTKMFDQPVVTGGHGGLKIEHSIEHSDKLSLNLTQAIALALRHNTTIRTTYMSRISERYQYYLEKRNREFWYYANSDPNISISATRNIQQNIGGGGGTYGSYIPATNINPSTSGSINKSASTNTRHTVNAKNKHLSTKASNSGTSATGSGNVGSDFFTGGISGSNSNSYSIQPQLGFTSPIGTKINLNGELSNDSGRTISASISVTQPLLKGFGYAINKIPWQQAQLTEKENILSLRTQVSSIILQVIQKYRQLIQSSLTCQNNLQALAEAEQTLKNNKDQVEAGRMARSQLLSSKIQVQTAKNSLISSENSMKQQQRTFATLLGLDKNIEFQLNNELKLPSITLNEKHLIDIALENRPDYLKSKLTYQSDLLKVKQDKNNMLWDLSLNASAGRTDIPSSRLKENNYSIGLSLTVPLDNTSDKQTLLSSKITAENDAISLRQDKLNIVASVHNKVSSLEQTYKAFKIQEQQVLLQEEQVKNTELSLKYGRSSAYDLAQQQQQLNDTRNQLVSSKIDYLNQLSELDDYLGTALATWQVVLAP